MRHFAIYEPNYFRGRARAVLSGGRPVASVVPRPDGTWHLRHHDGDDRGEVLHVSSADAYERLLATALSPGEMYIDMTPRRRPGDPRNPEEGP